MRLTLNRLFLPLLTLSAPLPLLAANGHYVPGIEASGGAFMPPVQGLYYRAYLVHYDIRQVADARGDDMPGNNTGSVTAFANRLLYVTDRTFLGANYGVEAIVPVQRTSLRFRGLGVDSSESGVGDVYLGPVVLGWHGAQWDTVFAAGFWLDTAEPESRPAAHHSTGQQAANLTLGGHFH